MYFIFRVLSNIPSKSKPSSSKKPKELKESKKVEEISPASQENSPTFDKLAHDDDEKEKMS